jgi:hypothetical protein
MIRVVLSCDTCDAEIRASSAKMVCLIANREGWGHTADTKHGGTNHVCPECIRLDALEAELRTKGAAT